MKADLAGLGYQINVLVLFWPGLYLMKLKLNKLSYHYDESLNGWKIAGRVVEKINIFKAKKT